VRLSDCARGHGCGRLPPQGLALDEAAFSALVDPGHQIATGTPAAIFNTAQSNNSLHAWALVCINNGVVDLHSFYPALADAALRAIFSAIAAPATIAPNFRIIFGADSHSIIRYQPILRSVITNHIASIQPTPPNYSIAIDRPGPHGVPYAITLDAGDLAALRFESPPPADDLPVQAQPEPPTPAESPTPQTPPRPAAGATPPTNLRRRQHYHTSPGDNAQSNSACAPSNTTLAIGIAMHTPAIILPSQAIIETTQIMIGTSQVANVPTNLASVAAAVAIFTSAAGVVAILRAKSPPML
jgi:hypothetical protein